MVSRKKRKDYVDFVKRCEHCKVEYRRNPGVAAHQFRAQRFCSIGCAKRIRDRTSFLDRFFDRFMPEPNSGCWIWTGTESSHGYGQMSVNGKVRLMHQLSYEVHTGSIPKGLSVLHRCDVRLCINPGHLYTGTTARNVRDMIERKRHRYGERNTASKLSAEKVKTIRASDLSDTELAVLYGVSRPAIRNARHGSTWRHVT